MIYLDTSVLIAMHTPEPGSQIAIDWMARSPIQDFSISLWTVTEFTSALARKVRMQRLSLDESKQARAEFEVLRESLTVRVPEPEDFNLASRMMDDPLSGLRAGDALHLAIVLRSRMMLATFDTVLRKAAAAFDVEIVAI